jgi:hypothetical protein
LPNHIDKIIDGEIKNCLLTTKQAKAGQAPSEENVKCSCTDVCEDPNLDIGGPACGSDHITYKNRCSLAKAACGKQENITVLAEMACSKYTN